MASRKTPSPSAWIVTPGDGICFARSNGSIPNPTTRCVGICEPLGLFAVRCCISVEAGLLGNCRAADVEEAELPL
jgi:hypothetical protein